MSGGTARRLSACLLAALTAGCNVGTSTPQPRNGGTIYVALDAMPSTLNPLVSQDAVSRRAYTPLFPLLYEAEPDLSLSPELAAGAPAFGDGGLTITVALRQDARWSDGTPITSADVVFTVTSEMNPSLQTQTPFNWSPLVTVKAVDAHTVRFTLSRPDAAFIADDLVTPVVPQHTLQSVNPASMASAAYSSAPSVSGGPFVYASRTADSITFNANPAFFLGRPHADHLVEHVVAADSAAAALAEGTLSFDPQLTPDAAAQAVISSGVTVESYADTSFAAVLFNLRGGRPFASGSTRQAFADSIDHDNLVSQVTGTVNDIPIWGDVNPASWAYNSAAPHQYQQNTSKARQLLNGSSLQAQLLVPAGASLLQGAATAIAQQASTAGITLMMRSEPLQQYEDALQSGDFDLAMVSLQTSLDPDPAALYAPSGADNLGGYDDPAVTALISQEESATAASLTALQQVRAPIIAHLEQLVTADLPLYFLWTPRHSVGFGALLAGVAGAGVQLDNDRANSFYADWFLTQ